MNCKKGDLARIVKPFTNPLLLDLYVTCVRQSFPGEIVISKNGSGTEHKEAHLAGWLCDASHGDFPRLIADCALRPIRDNPGNEHWVTEARNKLKGKTEITERGELA